MRRVHSQWACAFPVPGDLVTERSGKMAERARLIPRCLGIGGTGGSVQRPRARLDTCRAYRPGDADQGMAVPPQSGEVRGLASPGDAICRGAEICAHLREESCETLRAEQNAQVIERGGREQEGCRLRSATGLSPARTMKRTRTCLHLILRIRVKPAWPPTFAQRLHPFSANRATNQPVQK